MALPWNYKGSGHMGLKLNLTNACLVGMCSLIILLLFMAVLDQRRNLRGFPLETPSTRCDVDFTGLACDRLLIESKTQTVLSVATQVIIPLFAAFFGALAAFLLENMQRMRAEKRRFRAAGNETLLALGFYLSLIHI